MESLLEGLQADRKAAADERFQLNMERAEAEYQRRELEKQRADLEEERVRILNDARTRARRELEAVQSQLARIRGEAGRQKLTPEKLSELRGKTRALSEKNVLEQPRVHRPSEVPDEPVESGPLEIGDTVRIRSMGQRGELLSLPDTRGEVEVQLGSLKMRVRSKDIERLSRRQARGEERPLLTLPPRDDTVTPDMQLDVRGWRVDDMLPEVDQYLNDAYMAGMPFVRVLHGKGTGALRQALRQQLTHHPLVKAYESAPANEGGDGVTVVKLGT